MRGKTGFLLLSRIASAGTTLVVVAVVARFRTPDELGAIGLGFAIGAIAAVASDLGLASLAIREIARTPSRAGTMLGASLAIRIVTVPAVLLVSALIAVTLFPSEAVPIVLVVAGLVAQAAAEATRSLAIAAERMEVHAAHAVTENLLWAGSICAVLVAGAHLDLALAVGLAVLVGSVVAGLAIDRLVLGAPVRRPTDAELRDTLRLLGPFAAFGLIGIAYSRIDTVIVGVVLPAGSIAGAGLYFAAARLVAGFEYLPEAVSRALYPELARRGAGGAEALPVIRPAADRLLALGLLVPTVLVVGADWIMSTVFGEVVGADGWIVAALSIAVPLRFLGYLYGTTLTSHDAQSRRVLAAGVALLIVVIVDALLVPRVGIAGAVSGAVLGSVAVAAIYGISVARRLDAIPIDVPTSALALVAALIAIGAGLLVAGVAGPVIGIAAAVLVYVAGLALSPARALLRRRTSAGT